MAGGRGGAGRLAHQPAAGLPRRRCPPEDGPRRAPGERMAGMEGARMPVAPVSHLPGARVVPDGDPRLDVPRLPRCGSSSSPEPLPMTAWPLRRTVAAFSGAHGVPSGAACARWLPSIPSTAASRQASPRPSRVRSTPAGSVSSARTTASSTTSPVNLIGGATPATTSGSGSRRGHTSPL